MRVRRRLPPPPHWRAIRMLRIAVRRRLPRLVRRMPTGPALVWAGAALVPFLVGYLLAAVVLFPAPIFASTEVVPRLIGLDEDDARETLAATGLQVSVVDARSHPSAPRGRVVWQDPPQGVTVPERTAVSFTVSRGPRRIPVPDLAGYDAELAHQLITAAGLTVQQVDATQAPVPRGIVVNTRPPAGTTLRPASGVTLVVSVGAPTITVPDLRGLTREDAGMVLEQAGLTLGTWGWRTTRAQEAGTILEQDPAPGTLSAPGTAVRVTLARSRSP